MWGGVYQVGHVPHKEIMLISEFGAAACCTSLQVFIESRCQSRVGVHTHLLNFSIVSRLHSVIVERERIQH
jgi:hypothetical protein